MLSGWRKVLDLSGAESPGWQTKTSVTRWRAEATSLAGTATLSLILM
jgi:hypothetical protein